MSQNKPQQVKSSLRAHRKVDRSSFDASREDTSWNIQQSCGGGGGAGTEREEKPKENRDKWHGESKAHNLSRNIKRQRARVGVGGEGEVAGT